MLISALGFISRARVHELRHHVLKSNKYCESFAIFIPSSIHVILPMYNDLQQGTINAHLSIRSSPHAKSMQAYLFTHLLYHAMSKSPIQSNPIPMLYPERLPKCKDYAYLTVGCQLGAGGCHLPFWSQPALFPPPPPPLELPFAPRISGF